MNDAVEKQVAYHISPLRLWLVPVLSVGFAVFLVCLGLDAGAPANTKNLALGMGIIAFVFGLVMYWILRRTRLVLSSGGIQLYQFGYMLETDWSNVAHLTDESGFEGLILHQPMVCPGARTLSSHRLTTTIEGTSSFSGEQIQLIAAHRFIPLAAFGHALKNGRLRDDLTRRACLSNG